MEKSVSPMFVNKLILAPIARYSDTAFRKLCLECGADLSYTPLISVKAFLFNKDRGISDFKIISKVRPVGIQLFGYEPKEFVEVGKIAQYFCDFIDINCGCPAPKVLKSKGGSYLLKEPKRIGEIISALKATLHVPVTLKIRSHIDNKYVAEQVGRISEQAGADAITVHPRSVEQRYSGRADWSIIKKLSSLLSIPVIGNGDVVSYSSYKKLKSFTNSNSIMIGRAALVNPFVFRDIKNGSTTLKTKETAKEFIIKYSRYLSDLREPSHRKSTSLKIHVLSLLSGLKSSRELKNKVALAHSYDEILSLVLRSLDNRE